jgi:hypothetical protein
VNHSQESTWQVHHPMIIMLVVLLNNKAGELRRGMGESSSIIESQTYSGGSESSLCTAQ